MNLVAAAGKPKLAMSWHAPAVRVSMARMPISAWVISLAMRAKAVMRMIVEAMFWMKR